MTLARSKAIYRRIGGVMYASAPCLLKQIQHALNYSAKDWLGHQATHPTFIKIQKCTTFFIDRRLHIHVTKQRLNCFPAK